VAADTWDARDLPILRAIVEMSDDGAWYIDPPAIAEYTGLGVETVNTGLRALALENPPFFEYSDRTAMGQSQREIGGIHNPTGHARRMVGTWPKPEDRIAEMIAVLLEAAEREPEVLPRPRLPPAGSLPPRLSSRSTLSMRR
jgi:hypothetical protein